MPLRHLLVAGAVPVSSEVEQQARQQAHVHQLLRWDSLVGRVLGHVQTTVLGHVQTTTTHTALVGDKNDVPLTMSAEARTLPRMKKVSAPCGLPDLIQVPDAAEGEEDTTARASWTSASSAADDPPLPDLSASLRLRLGHIQQVRRLTRREGQVSRPDPLLVTPPRVAAAPTPRPVIPSRRVSAPASPSALAARLRKISVSDTLRQVGRDLRRIADHLQLSRILGQQQAQQSGGEPGWLPTLTGAIGCVVICGIGALLNRALNR